MEGGRTDQQQEAGGPAARVQRLGFAAWLRRQAGAPLEEAVSEASTSDAEDAELMVPAADHPQAAAQGSNGSSRASSISGGGRVGGLPVPAVPVPVLPGQLARHATLAPRLPDCRAETRLTSDTCIRARQEMTVMLAAPGMPLHQAPVLTATQASALMSAICEPLLSLPVGRLTRKLSAPTKLQATEDKGIVSLWLLPDDSLSLVWQSAQLLSAAAVDEATSAATAAATAGCAPSSYSSASCIGAHESGSVAGNAGSRDDGPSSSSSGATAQPRHLQQSCSVAVWEELAHFPAHAHLLDDAPVVTIHMLRGDSSGRSFYIRVRNDVAEANLEAATAAVPDASRLLQQHRATSAAGGAAAADAGEPAGAPRMYFWLADKDLGKAVYGLGRLKSLLKRPPTLSKRSGVPERQLAQLGAWVQQADLAAAEQHRAALAAAQLRLEELQLRMEEVQLQLQMEGAQPQLEGQLEGQPQGGVVVSRSAACGPPASPARPLPSFGGNGRAHLSPLLQGGPCNPAMLLGQQLGGSGMAAAVPMLGSMAAQPASSPAGDGPGAANASANAGASAAELGSTVVASSSSTVSATAAALYQDHRFNVVCPCTISVVVGMKVEGAGADAALLPAEASNRARAVAECQAKAAVDCSGRQRIEERLAEVVIRNIRAQRNRARQARQALRDSATRQEQVERAQALARQATGRSPPQPAHSAPASPASPAAAAALLALEPPPPHEQQQLPQQQAAGVVGADTPPRPSHFGSSGGSGDSVLDRPASSPEPRRRAFSSPATLPLPRAVLPAGRVTIGNLHSLLAQPQGGQGGTSRELGQADPAATAEGAGAVHAGRVSVAELADLLGKHAKLD